MLVLPVAIVQIIAYSAIFRWGTQILCKDIQYCSVVSRKKNSLEVQKHRVYVYREQGKRACVYTVQGRGTGKVREPLNEFITYNAFIVS